MYHSLTGCLTGNVKRNEEIKRLWEDGGRMEVVMELFVDD